MYEVIKKIFVFILILILSNLATSMLNPAAVYCNSLGYEYVIEQTPEGEIGFCKFKDGSKCSDWEFLSGKCGQKYSYCSKEGYKIKTTTDFEKCAHLFSEECAVCVLKNGTEIEVTKLMNLNFDEGVCGDNICVLGENFLSCPQDCPSGSYDGYCDGLKDGKCDPDCEIGKDPDCKISTTTTTIAVICGNGKCEQNENFGNCPEDCPSGERDNYCDAQSDDKCDPDCRAELDPDCTTVRCGDKICNFEQGENFLNCREDCSSGSKDNYCDKIVDKICDPDCTNLEDPDCKRTEPLPIYLILVILIISLLIIFLIKKIKSGNY
ncbi:MAG: DUF333 domain-containing protein [Candidatus Altiarchaeota archaeon]